jgi:uncharacterized OB-fold protein
MTTSPEVLLAMPAQIKMPYTLTPGRALGIYLAELGNRRIIASQHSESGTTLVPAQDFTGDGEPVTSFVEVTGHGIVVAETTTPTGTLGLVLLDGTDVPLVHRLLPSDGVLPVSGDRIAAVWASETTGSADDLTGFGAETEPVEGHTGSIPAADLADPLEQVAYTMTLDYEHAYGHYYGTLFDGVRTDRRLRGVRCSDCRRVLLPPRPRCDVCFAPTAEWVDVAATGVIQACSVVHIEFIGQRLTPPYIYAEIVLDGSSTRLIHMVGGEAADADKQAVSPGDRVRAVWSDRRTGSLADIDHFELIVEGS